MKWYSLIVSVVLVYIIIVLLMTFTPTTHNGSRKARGEWETHPCDLPSPGRLGSENGNIWKCKCGRRWKYDTSLYPNPWVEQTVEMDLAEAQAKLKEAECQLRQDGILLQRIEDSQ
jgi:hypothetical protein